MPREPSFYVNVPSRVDPTAAPDGKDALVVLVPVGHMILERGGEGQNWDALVQRAKGQILEVLEKRLGVKDFEKMIVWEEVNTPLTCKCRQGRGCSCKICRLKPIRFALLALQGKTNST